LRTTNGSANTGVGTYVMKDGTGVGNTIIGAYSARSKVTGDFNIYVGLNVADDVNNTESGTIRIGDSVYTNQAAFISAIRGVTTGAADAVGVMIDCSGQLGTINSSRRYKEDIQDMGEASSGLMKLRPVTYRYQQPYADGSNPVDYGLIAEEVEEVYPGLVTHLASGEVETVQYHKINAMLLNEVQKQQREIEALKAKLAGMSALESRLAALETAASAAR
jgi:hypothetical protein